MKPLPMTAMICTAMILIGCARGDKDGIGVQGNRKQIGVVTVDEVSVRLDPIVYSSRVAVLSTGENVEVVDRSREMGRVSGKSDYWYKIKLRNGLSGWVFGANMKIFEEGSSSTVESFAKELRAEEDQKARKELRGKWWSVAGDETFTDHILSLREDGTYASLRKGSTTPVDGTYELNTADGVITFSKGTSFGDKASFMIRGEIYLLETMVDGKEVKFKKLSSNPDFKGELSLPEPVDTKTEPASTAE
jgi:hypothetical protein